MINNFDVIIIGAGAAGLMCAARAGKNGRSVLLIDHADKAGEKIRISGGGRCNFTNLYCGPDNFLSQNTHFAKSALSRYTPYDFIELVNAYGIAFHEKTKGQLFCDGRSQEIIDKKYRRRVYTDDRTAVFELSLACDCHGWTIHSQNGREPIWL